MKFRLANSKHFPWSDDPESAWFIPPPPPDIDFHLFCMNTIEAPVKPAEFTLEVAEMDFQFELEQWNLDEKRVESANRYVERMNEHLCQKYV